MPSKRIRFREITTDRKGIDKAGYNPPPAVKVNRPVPSPPSPPPPRPLSPGPWRPKNRA